MFDINPIQTTIIYNATAFLVSTAIVLRVTGDKKYVFETLVFRINKGTGKPDYNHESPGGFTQELGQVQEQHERACRRIRNHAESIEMECMEEEEMIRDDEWRTERAFFR